MRASFVWRAAICFILLAGFVLDSRSVAGQVDERSSLAADVAVALSRLEAAGDFDALYDRMHPDAQAVVPQAAIEGWYKDN